MQPIVLTLLFICLSLKAQADGYQRQLGDDYGDAFVNYMPYVKPVKAKPQPAKLPAASTPKPTKSEGPEKVDVKWLRTNYPLLEERAIDNPTQENVEAYLYTKRIILDKAQRFAEMDMKVVNSDPFLNENNRIPYASMGSQAVQRANYEATEKAVEEMGKVGGLLVFIDSACRFCMMQLPIVHTLQNLYGMNTLVISIDGHRPKGYQGKVFMDNGLFRKLQLQLTPSIVYVPHPTGYQAASDPNHYLVVAQGFYAQDELVKQIAFAGFTTNLLSPAVTHDLSVWDTGVASSGDLNSLKLDVNHPDAFKKIMDPILAKQYQGAHP